MARALPRGLTQTQLELMDERTRLREIAYGPNQDQYGRGVASMARTRLRAIEAKLVAPERPAPVSPAKKPIAKKPAAAPAAPAVPAVPVAQPALPAAINVAPVNPVIPELQQVTSIPAPEVPSIDDAAVDIAAQQPLDPIAQALGLTRRKKYGIGATTLTGELGLSNLGGIASRTLLGG
jgi:hypothetical protein